VFIVKAEVRTETGPTTYQLYATEAVRVAASRSAQSHGPSPEIEVQLTDIDGRVRRTLDVGQGIDHYCAVYIMNAQGKTVDSVYPGPRSIGGTTSIAA
jgi:hypothetical protein